MPIKVVEYTTPQLVDLLSEFSKTSSEDVRAKQHIPYFDAYFSQLGAKTILVEFDYIDHLLVMFSKLSAITGNATNSVPIFKWLSLQKTI